MIHLNYLPPKSTRNLSTIPSPAHEKENVALFLFLRREESIQPTSCSLIWKEVGGGLPVSNQIRLHTASLSQCRAELKTVKKQFRKYCWSVPTAGKNFIFAPPPSPISRFPETDHCISDERSRLSLPLLSPLSYLRRSPKFSISRRRRRRRRMELRQARSEATVIASLANLKIHCLCCISSPNSLLLQ